MFWLLIIVLAIYSVKMTLLTQAFMQSVPVHMDCWIEVIVYRQELPHLKYLYQEGRLATKPL